MVLLSLSLSLSHTHTLSKKKEEEGGIILFFCRAGEFSPFCAARQAEGEEFAEREITLGRNKGRAAWHACLLDAQVQQN